MTVYSVTDTHPFTGKSVTREYEVENRNEARQKFVEEIHKDAKDVETVEALKAFLEVRYVSGDKDTEKYQRCTTCAAEFTELEIENASCCPACGDKGVPCLISDDVTVKINWHELRILGIWAENWARKIQKENPETSSGSMLTVLSIVGRLQNQHPDKPKLTLFSEIREAKEHFEKKGSKIKIQSDLDDDEVLGL